MQIIYLAAFDSQGQIVRNINQGQAQLNFVEILQENENQSQIAHFFSERSSQSWSLGTFKLEQITLVGEPGRDYSLTVKAR